MIAIYITSIISIYLFIVVQDMNELDAIFDGLPNNKFANLFVIALLPIIVLIALLIKILQELKEINNKKEGK